VPWFDGISFGKSVPTSKAEEGSPEHADIRRVPESARERFVRFRRGSAAIVVATKTVDDFRPANCQRWGSDWQAEIRRHRSDQIKCESDPPPGRWTTPGFPEPPCFAATKRTSIQGRPAPPCWAKTVFCLGQFDPACMGEHASATRICSARNRGFSRIQAERGCLKHDTHGG